MAGREKGSKIVDGKVVPPTVGSVPTRVASGDLPQLGSPQPAAAPVQDFTDGRIEVVPGPGGRVDVVIQPANRKALVQARNKLNEWVTFYEISEKGASFPIIPPEKADPKVEYTAVRLLEVTCGVNYAGGSDE